MKTQKPFLCGLGVVLLAPAAFANNAKVCFEAEKPATIQSPLKIVGSKGAQAAEASGKGYLEIPWDENKTKGIGQATYKFNVKTAGTYYIWVRAYWMNGCGNSVGVSVNGGPLVTIEDSTADHWHYVGGKKRVALKAGQNTLILKNTETGVKVDQFFFCQDGDYTPTGIRKVTS
jgi:hypothetical protein